MRQTTLSTVLALSLIMAYSLLLGSLLPDSLTFPDIWDPVDLALNLFIWAVGTIAIVHSSRVILRISHKRTQLGDIVALFMERELRAQGLQKPTEEFLDKLASELEVIRKEAQSQVSDPVIL